MLNKVKKINLKKIKAHGGDVIKFIDKNNKYFFSFGEVYFSEINKGFFKGWNLHKKCHCLMTVVYGSVEFTLMNYSQNKKKKFIINNKNPQLLIIPPKIWFKFRSLQNKSTICNLIDRIHNKNETKKIPIFS